MIFLLFWEGTFIQRGGRLFEGAFISKSEILGGRLFEGAFISKSEILGGRSFEGGVYSRRGVYSRKYDILFLIVSRT